MSKGNCQLVNCLMYNQFCLSSLERPESTNTFCRRPVWKNKTEIWSRKSRIKWFSEKLAHFVHSGKSWEVGAIFHLTKEGHFSYVTNYQPFSWQSQLLSEMAQKVTSKRNRSTDIKFRLQCVLVRKSTLFPHICHSANGRQLDDLLSRTFDSIAARRQMQYISGPAQTSGDQSSL